MLNLSQQEFPRALNGFVVASILLSVGVGLLGLCGWILHISILKTALPGLVAIKANTAICFVLIGAALWLQRNRQALSDVKGRVAWIFAGTAVTLGWLSLAETTFGWDLSIDQLLFSETAAEAIGSVRPGLMSTVTALNFTLLGLALLLLNWRTKGSAWPAPFLCFGAEITSIFTLLDFILVPKGFHAHIALQTVITFCVLPVGVVLARPEWGVGALLAGASPGSQLAEKLLDIRAPGSFLWAWPLRYGFAVAIAALAILLRAVPGFLPGGLTYITDTPAVIIAAVVAGVGPGQTGEGNCANVLSHPRPVYRSDAVRSCH